MNTSWKIVTVTGVVSGLALGGFSLAAAADDTPRKLDPVLVDGPAVSPDAMVDDAATTPITVEVPPAIPQLPPPSDDGSSPASPAPGAGDVDDDDESPGQPAPAPAPAPDRGDDGPGSDDRPELGDDGSDSDDDPESDDDGSDDDGSDDDGSDDDGSDD